MNVFPTPSRRLGHEGEGSFLDIILGIIGGLAGGRLFEHFGETGIRL
jgi:uncharacterized membrane protein YeaQ/YmgE (transglycosylase-associated protein family)